MRLGLCLRRAGQQLLVSGRFLRTDRAIGVGVRRSNVFAGAGRLAVRALGRRRTAALWLPARTSRCAAATLLHTRLIHLRAQLIPNLLDGRRQLALGDFAIGIAVELLEDFGRFSRIGPTRFCRALQVDFVNVALVLRVELGEKRVSDAGGVRRCDTRCHTFLHLACIDPNE